MNQLCFIAYLSGAKEKEGRKGAGDFISNQGPGTKEAALEVLRRCIIGPTEFEMQSKCNRMSTLTYQKPVLLFFVFTTCVANVRCVHPFLGGGKNPQG